MKIADQFAASCNSIPDYFQKKELLSLPHCILPPIEEQSGSYELEYNYYQGFTPLFWSYHTRPGTVGSQNEATGDEKVEWRRIDPFQPYGEY